MHQRRDMYIWDDIHKCTQLFCGAPIRFGYNMINTMIYTRENMRALTIDLD